ncbi:MAG: hypothetical protein ABI779_18200 [Acidobacteriota bacterium]
MTKHEFVARLAHDPIAVEPVANLTYYRVSLHGARHAKNAVLIGLAPVAGTLLAEDYGQVYARVNGKKMKLSPRDVQVIVSRLQQIFTRGGDPKRWPGAARERD